MHIIKLKKVPLRKCVATHKMFPKTELIRVVKTPDNKIVVDLSGKLNGRGAYLQPDQILLEKIKSNRALERSLKIKITDIFYEELSLKISERRNMLG